MPPSARPAREAPGEPARVFVTGMGAVSPYGIGAAALVGGLFEARSAIGPVRSFDASRLPVRFGGEMPLLTREPDFLVKEDPFVSRVTLAAVRAAREAVRSAGLRDTAAPSDGAAPSAPAERAPGSAGAFIGTGFGTLPDSAEAFYRYAELGDAGTRPSTIPRLMLNAPSAWVAIKLGLSGPNRVLSTACSSGSNAIGEAFREIRERRADRMVAGGVDACFTREMLLLWTRLRVLSRRNDRPEAASRPFDRRRDGMVLSEASILFQLESGESVRARGAVPLAEITGYGTSCDAAHITAPRAEMQALAIRRALEDAGTEGGAVDLVLAHGTATPTNDPIEAESLRLVLGAHAARVPVAAVKSSLGHTMGASGPAGVAAAIEALRSGRLPPTLNLEDPDPACALQVTGPRAEPAPVGVALVDAFGFGGSNAVLVLRRANGI